MCVLRMLGIHSTYLVVALVSILSSYLGLRPSAGKGKIAQHVRTLCSIVCSHEMLVGDALAGGYPLSGRCDILCVLSVRMG